MNKHFAELKNKSKQELKDFINDKLHELFQLRMKKNTTENPKTHQFSVLRKAIARAKTLLNQ